MLDVIVSVPHPLAADDDTVGTIHVGAGGQAANVAAWTAHLGGRARYLGPLSNDLAGSLVAGELTRHGVEVVGSRSDGRAGVVVSIVAGGERTMASDPGAARRVDSDAPDERWLAGCSWLFISGYSLLRSEEAGVALAAARLARAAGAAIAVDLSASSLIHAFGPERFRLLLAELEPDLVFANEREWEAVDGAREPPAPAWVLKRGRRGCTFHLPDGVVELPAPAGAPVDPTGAGDALAAGFLVGGPELALDAAGRCVARLGAQP